MYLMANRVSFDSIPSFLQENLIVKRTAQEIFKNLCDNYEKHQTITDQDLISFSSFFGETFERALEIIENNKITYYHTCSDKVGIYKVQKMNEEDWPNRNPCMEQFMCLPREMPSLFSRSPSDWVQVPPQTMPWSFPIESHPSVMKFTAGDCDKHPASIKRKGGEALDMPPSKMLVTEEKMAAHMKGLHISDVESDNTSFENLDCKNNTNESDKHPRLIISDEIKNLKSESIIPDAILKKMEKPEMALVLWQPPAADLQRRLEELKKLSKKKEGEKKEINLKVKSKEEKDMDIVMDTELENNNENSIFSPGNQVPSLQNQYFQPHLQFHGFSSFL